MSQPDSPLCQLAGNYFNPDYELDAPDPDGIVRKFARNEVPDAVRALTGEIADALADSPTELQLKELWLDTYDSYFEPQFIGLTYREWFLRMLEILRAG